MDFGDCISAHEQWKTRLTLLLRGESSEALDPLRIAKDDQCPLGRWIHGEGQQLYGAHGVFLGLRDRHALFHRCAGEVVRKFLAGDLDGARQQLAGDFARLSSETIRAIAKLRQLTGS